MSAISRANLALLIVGFASFIAMGAGQSLYGPALAAFGRSFDISLVQAGWAVTSFWLGSAAGVALAFFVPQRVTPRTSLAGMAMGAVIIAAAPDWGLTLAGAFVYGIGYGGATTVFNPRILHAFGSRGPSMFSLLNAAFSLGAICAPLVFVALGSDPRLAYGIVAVACATICVFAHDSASPSESVAPSGRLHLHWPVLGFQAVAIGLEASLIGIGPAALIRAGIGETDAAELLSMFFVAFLGVRMLLILTMPLLPPFAFYLMAMGVAAVAAAGASLLSPEPFFVMMGMSAGAFFPSSFVTAMGKMGRDPRVPPVIVAAGLVGAIVAPLALSFIATAMGPRGFFQLVAGIAALTALVAALCLRGMIRG